MTVIDERGVLLPEDVLLNEEESLYELVDGRLVPKVLDMKSSKLIGFLTTELTIFSRSARIAPHILPEQTYQCFPSKPRQVRRPDLSVILEHRATRADIEAEGHVVITPDIAIEIVSKTNTLFDLEGKLEDYNDARIPLVILINPRGRRVVVYKHGRIERDLKPGDTLTLDPVLPGFALDVKAIFDSIGLT
jgi:Uma2 family endonuclease